jgi:hypothetical protein
VGGQTPFQRGGFAIVQIDSAGDVIRAYWGTIPIGFPQDANTAESLAFLNGARCSSREEPNLFISDCLSVVDTWNKCFVWAAGSKRPQGGIWKQAWDEGAAEKLTGVEKVKAHQALDSLEGDELFRARGNHMADYYANQGTELHGFSENELKVVAKVCDGKVAWLVEFGKRLSAWPRAHDLFGELEREQGPEGPANPKLKHKFEYDETGKWRCSACWYTPRVEGVVPTIAAKARCPGRVAKITDLVGDPQGHVLVYGLGVVSNRVIIWCLRCGCYAHEKPRHLRLPCLGIPQTTTAERTLKITGMGRDPISDEPLCGQGYLRHNQYGKYTPPEDEYD